MSSAKLPSACDILSWLARVPDDRLRPVLTAAFAAAERENDRLIITAGKNASPSISGTDSGEIKSDCSSNGYWAYPLYCWTGTDGFLVVNLDGSLCSFESQGLVRSALFFEADEADEYPDLLSKLYANLLNLEDSQAYELTGDEAAAAAAQGGSLQIPGERKFKNPAGFFYVLDADKHALSKIFTSVRRTGEERRTEEMHAFLLYETAKYLVTSQSHEYVDCMPFDEDETQNKKRRVNLY